MYPVYLENSRKFSDKKLNNTKNILIESFKGNSLLKNAIYDINSNSSDNNNINKNKNKNYVLIKNIRKTFFYYNKFLDRIKKSTKSTNYSNYSSFDLKMTKNSSKSKKITTF